ncbi:MAG: DNA mismatch repair protein MutS [Lachnospiraceae bacterium]|nr:DNA mismatch repair protein MutS [Lachnospiraceae bacterium]
MMAHYISMREKYEDCIIFYRLGDFYEMFFDDAENVSKELDIALTGKSCGLPEKAPMCGVPFHSVDIYLNQLVEKGYKVAICEQLEDPKAAKGIVKRDVIRIVTPGTSIDIQSMDDKKNSFLMSVVYAGSRFGISAADLTTGSFKVTECGSFSALMDEINKLMPKEIICNKDLLMTGFNAPDIRSKLGITVNIPDNRYFREDNAKEALEEHFRVKSLDGLGLADFPIGVMAAGAVLIYLKETQKNSLNNILTINPYVNSDYLLIDSASRRNLELTETLRDKRRKGSLLWVLDHTKTAMGGRKIRNFIEEPLINAEQIVRRLDAVEEMNNRVIDRDELREYLSPVYDLERLLCKVTYGSANPRDIIMLKTSFKMLPPVKNLLLDFNSPLLTELTAKLDTLEDLCDDIEKAIVDDPPLAQKEGGIIKDGFDKTVDELRSVKLNGKKMLAELEEREKQATGIKNLRVKFSKVFGYAIEVTNSYLDKVPTHYVRKQTLSGSERFITDELKELEDKLLNSEERLTELEYRIFDGIRKKVGDNVSRILSTADTIAYLDVLQSLSYVAEHNDYVRPKINEKGYIHVKAARHPVVEMMMSGSDSYIPNDINLDTGKNLISIITGPNMAGKSTYMRSSALITLMAHVGSFVPAKSADISIVDRIFTRVGASDDLASGQSTFMVEMTEVANILRNATDRSLLILDEIGRGTSTFDGLSIAWAVIEHIADKAKLGAKTLFATHYHELTELEGKIPGLNNYCVAVKENGKDVIFLRKIIRGGADRSYGIHVARLAGVPDSVTERAEKIAADLADNDITWSLSAIADESSAAVIGRGRGVPRYDEVDLNQMSLFDTLSDNDILKQLAELDLSHMTPMDALNHLYKLQNDIKNRW